MALEKLLLSSDLVLNVETGVDSNSNPTYGKKVFKGLKADAPLQNTVDVALALGTAYISMRSFQIDETHKIVDNV